MKAFTLESSMTTFGGVFYPTGYMVLMFPTAQDAKHACELLHADGVNEDTISLLTPEDFVREVAHVQGDDDEDSLPSPGTEGDTCRHFLELAREGCHALLVRAPSAKQSDHVMQVLKGLPITYGQRYRHFVIEDLT